MKIYYNLPEIKDVLVNFYNVTKIRIAIFDNHFQENISYPTRIAPFCTKLRTNKEFNNKCRDCDVENFTRCKKELETISYICHAGFYEIITPIIANDELLGYIMCGQFINEEQEHLSVSEMVEYIKQYDFDGNQLKSIYEQTLTIDNAQAASIAKMMEVIAFFLHSNNNIYLESNDIAEQINKYIMDNIQNDITLKDLCKRFNYHKTTFCQMVKKIYGMGIMKHVTKMRIKKAKELLASTDLYINEISIRVGIPDYNYFTKVFKAEENCTPKEYRKYSIVNIIDSN